MEMELINQLADKLIKTNQSVLDLQDIIAELSRRLVLLENREAE